MNTPYINTVELYYVQQPLTKSPIERGHQGSHKNLPAVEKLKQSLKERKRKTGYVIQRIDAEENTYLYIYLNAVLERHIKLLV
jgi:hypothetical protein